MTGLVPPTVVDSGFRNRYNIIGFCGIDLSNKPVDYYITNTEEHTVE